MEDFLFCKKLTGRASGEEIYELLNDGYFDFKQLDWSKCSGICTDGAAAFTGINKGLKGLIKHIAPHIEFKHCIIHRQALVSKDIDGELYKILQDVIIVINYIKSNSLNSRLFTILCNEIGSAFEPLLHHTEVRWLISWQNFRMNF